MKKRALTALTFALITGGLLLSAPAAASAAPSAVEGLSDATIGEQSWPVECDLGSLVAGSVIVNCPADDDVEADEIVEQACYQVASSQVGLITITSVYCTDYGPLSTFLGDQQDEQELAESGDVNFNCGALDPVCAAQEDVANEIANFIVDSLEWVFGNSGLSTSSSLYQNALDQSGFWWTVTSFFTIAAAAVGIAWAALMGNKQRMIRALVGLAATFVTTWVAIFMLGYLLDIMDGLTEPILQSGLSSGSIADTVGSLLFPDGIDGQIAAFGNTPTVIFIVGLAIGLVVIVFVNSLRDFGLMVLIAFGPLAFALMPVRETGSWIRNWASAVLALLLTKPLILGLLVLVLSGVGQLESLYSIQALPMLIGFVLTLFMPFVAYGLFSFVGTAAAQVDQAGQGAGRAVQGAARMLPRPGQSGKNRVNPPDPAAANRPPDGRPPASGAGSPAAQVAAPSAAAPTSKSPAISGGRWPSASSKES